MKVKRYVDARASTIQSVALMLERGSEPTGELIEACRDLNAVMAKWARRVGFDPAAEEPTSA